MPVGRASKRREKNILELTQSLIIGGFDLIKSFILQVKSYSGLSHHMFG